MTRYKKGNAVYDGKSIVFGDVRIVNPSVEQLLAAGYVAEEVTAPTIDPAVVAAEEARQALADGDYKIIKCAEAALLDLPLPYDLAALHAEREQLRATVNGEEKG